MFKPRFIAGWLVWVVMYFAIRLPLIIAGFVVFPLAYLFRRGDHLLKLFWLWDNDEDGIYGNQWHIDKYDGEKNFKTAYMWSVVRNPANNMRFVLGVDRDSFIDEPLYEYFGDITSPSHNVARAIGYPAWQLTYVKVGIVWLPSFWYIKSTGIDTHFRIRLGWKCTMEWIRGNNLSDTGKFSGMTFQCMPRRRW